MKLIRYKLCFICRRLNLISYDKRSNTYVFLPARTCFSYLLIVASLNLLSNTDLLSAFVFIFPLLLGLEFHLGPLRY